MKRERLIKSCEGIFISFVGALHPYFCIESENEESLTLSIVALLYQIRSISLISKETRSLWQQTTHEQTVRAAPKMIRTAFTDL